MSPPMSPRSEILPSYPSIKSEDIDSALAYPAELVREGSIDLHRFRRGYY